VTANTKASRCGDPDENLPAIDHAAELLGPLAERDRPLGALTTYRVGGRAALFSEPQHARDLEQISAAVAATGVSLLVIGKGSNLLVADAGFAGLCVRLGERFATIEIDGTSVRSGGATAYPVLARRTAAAGLTGMEWAVGIPGSVGGAVRMNAGGHGAETSDRLVRCEIVDLSGPGARTVEARDLALAYRHSVVGDSEVVVMAEFSLERGDAVKSRVRISEIVRWRRDHQPGGQNAGSVFTNPPEDSAGRLVEEAGLKGMRIGTAAVSERHANFIQADPGGSADDVRRLIDEVQRLVAERLGVELITELRLVGFEEAR
jgi:UDP-N-acetylmuramate dehydrogenase